jgi:hypothetical protein
MRTCAVVFAGLFMALFVIAAQGATITFTGSELGMGDGIRTTTVAKTLDIDEDNVLGTDGYYYWNPDDQLGSQGGSSGAPFAENALISLPSYVDSILPAADAASASDFDYHAIDDPTAPPGAAVPNLEAGQATVQGWQDLEEQGVFVPEEKPAFSIVLGSSVPDRFRMAFVQDTYENQAKPGKNMPASFRVAGTGDDTGQIALMRNSRNDVDVYYLDVLAPSPGDTFTVYLTTHEDSIQDDGERIANQITTSVLAFDTPEPTMLALLLMGAFALLARRGRRRC